MEPILSSKKNVSVSPLQKSLPSRWITDCYDDSCQVKIGWNADLATAVGERSLGLEVGSKTSVEEVDAKTRRERLPGLEVIAAPAAVISWGAKEHRTRFA